MSMFMLDQSETVVGITIGAAVISTFLLYYLTRTSPSSNKRGIKDQETALLSRDIGDGVRISTLCSSDDVTDTPYDGVETLYDAFARGRKISGDCPCLGRRVGEEYQWISYNELADRVQNFGSGLIAEGVPAGGDVYIGIIGINCVDWVVAQLGAVHYSIVFVPMYDTLGDEAMCHILNQTGCQIVVAHPQKIEKMRKFLSAGSRQVRIVVKMCEDPTAEETASFSELNVAIKSMRDIEEKGVAAPSPLLPPKPSDIYTICYTSGTTGIPKGALISHQNMTTTMAGVMMTNADFILTPSDVHFSYLPLCHLFEMNVHMFSYTVGAAIGFYSGSALDLPDDIRILRPTVFPAVPRVLNKFMEKIKKTVSAKGAIAKWIFEKAVASKSYDLSRGIRQRDIWDRIILQKVRDGFGGRISLIATGAAPILPETLNFFRAVFGANVYEGYGQTESTAGCTFTQPLDFKGGHVGPPLPTNLIKLVDSSETGHFVRDGKGEICVKGKNVFMGYYKDEENTRSALDAEGWLHTGDIGEWNKTGCLMVIDRKKYIFKTSLGEYIAPEKIENVYEMNEMVQIAFVDGDSTKPKIAAVIVPDQEMYEKWTATIGKGGRSYEELLEDEDIVAKFLDVINSNAKKMLTGFELLAKIKLVDVTLTVDNDLVTPTFKKKRPSLRKHFSSEFKTLYKNMV